MDLNAMFYLKKFYLLFIAYLTFSFSLVSVAAQQSVNKTLVSWVSLKNLEVNSGSILTLQNGERFDGIVYGEKNPYKWMAGSELFNRTELNQTLYPIELNTANELIQMAIVYHSDQVIIYRDGKPFTRYNVKNIDLLSANSQTVVFGKRHIGSNGGIDGNIEDARIYDTALTEAQIKSLTPNQILDTEPKPYAWWSFQSEKIEDKMGRFNYAYLSGKAHIANGKLHLSQGDELVITKNEQQPADLNPPTWPKNPPNDWLTFHLAHPGSTVYGGAPGDPNPAFYYNGLYHLHYIYKTADGFSFAHVSSKDMVHWKWHKTVLRPEFTGHGMFSGTGFFTRDHKPLIIYHGAGSEKNWISYALDDNLDVWSQPEPVIAKNQHGQEVNITYWDPDAWYDEEQDSYFSLMGNFGHQPSLLASKDLKNWQYLGNLFHPNFPQNIDSTVDEDVSCANMFKIGNKWMLLNINHSRGARYFLGDFVDGKYLPESHAMMSWNGNQFFAPESLLDEAGNRVMWAWIMNLPISPTAVQSLPRKLWLPADGKLRIAPIENLKTLRYDEKLMSDIQVNMSRPVTLPLRGDALELNIEFFPSKTTLFGIDVLCNELAKDCLNISISKEKNELIVGNVHAPFNLKDYENLNLRIFIDKNLVEVFANDIQAAVAAKDFRSEGLQSEKAVLFTKDADLKIKQLSSWKLKSIYSRGMR